MTIRATSLIGALCLLLAGCAQDFAGPAGIGGDVLERIAQAIPGPTDPGALTPTGQPAEQHVAVSQSWGEPTVVPTGLQHGPRAVAESDGPYLLDAGDRLRVFVYGQPNLSRLYTVDHDGRIVVPLIGSVLARGKTTYAVAGAIRAKLAAEFVKDPQVTVDIQQNRPFYVLGEVRNAGQYPYVSGMTIETAVAIAGGYSERANQRKARISRRINGLVEVIEAPSDYVVQAGDTVYIYERWF